MTTAPQRLSPKVRMLGWLLATKWGRGNPVDIRVLIHDLWGDDAGGGPISARCCACVHMTRLRRAMRASGIEPFRPLWVNRGGEGARSSRAYMSPAETGRLLDYLVAELEAYG